MTFRSPFVQHALDLRARVRGSYDDYQLARYTHAETVCRGRMLNRDGMKAGIDPQRLFEGPEVRARRYASEELREYWRRYPRLSFEDYERQAYSMWVDTGVLP